MPEIDFRVPSDLELDALLEFQLSLGRQAELDLSNLTFKNPMVEFGKTMFQDVRPTGGKCAICHNNGGATAAGPDHQSLPSLLILTLSLILALNTLCYPPAFWINPDIPVDGGFGKPPALGPDIPNVGQGFGDGTFDAPVVIEAAATPPYFHNNSVATLEAAVGFLLFAGISDSIHSPPAPVPGGPGVNFAAPLNLKTDYSYFYCSLSESGRIHGTYRQGNGEQSVGNRGTINSSAEYYIDIALANTRDAIKVLKEGVYLNRIPTHRENLPMPAST